MLQTIEVRNAGSVGERELGGSERVRKSRFSGEMEKEDEIEEIPLAESYYVKGGSTKGKEKSAEKRISDERGEKKEKRYVEKGIAK